MSTNLRRFRIALIFAVLLLTAAGCGGEPTLYPVTGGVTLGGKPYERLIVYFRPINSKVNTYNMGVGETDDQGNLLLRSTAGNGLAAGKYRVSFSCMTIVGSGKTINTDEKADDNRNVVVVERVPAPYNSQEDSPVEFQITRGANEFIFDIPAS